MRRVLCWLVLMALLLSVVGPALASSPAGSPDYLAGYQQGKEAQHKYGVEQVGSKVYIRDATTLLPVYCEGKSTDYKQGFLDGYKAESDAFSRRWPLSLLVAVLLVGGICVLISLVIR